MSLIPYVVKHVDLIERTGEVSAFDEVVYIARGVDARIAKLESENHELRRQIQDWKDWLAGACV